MPDSDRHLYADYDLSDIQLEDPYFGRETQIPTRRITLSEEDYRKASDVIRDRYAGWIAVKDLETDTWIDVIAAPCDADCYCALALRTSRLHGAA